MCRTCCEHEEQCFLEQEIRKETSLLKSHFFQNFLKAISVLAVFVGGFYMVLFWPREIKISLEDKDRLQYYLTQAYEAGKGSESYARQMKNIMRLDMKFRHVLSFLHQGEQAFDMKQYSKALDNYKTVKKMLPDWDWIYVLIAQCYDALGQIDSAKTELTQAIELNPDSIKAYCVLGKIFEEADAHDDAILQYTKASFIDPKNPEVLLRLSELYLKKNRPSKAREYREKAQRINANKKNGQ
jgi:tetratricopeptide (TPR) repeat protein